MPNGRKVALLVAVATALFGIDARADEPTQGPKPKTVEEIVKEARERVENKYRGQPVSDWKPMTREEREEKPTEPKKRLYWLGFGFENTTMPQGELLRVRYQQRSEIPLDYLSPWSDTDLLNRNGQSGAFIFGRQLNDWLDVELTAHGQGSFYEYGDSTRVTAETMEPGNTRDTTVSQHTDFEERSYSITFLPKWSICDWFAVYGRLGVGYAQNRLESKMDLTASLRGPDRCTIQQGTNTEKCEATYVRTTRNVALIREHNTGFFPVAGVGIELTPVVRLEYMVRKNVPMGNDTVDVDTNLYLTFRYMSNWL